MSAPPERFTSFTTTDDTPLRGEIFSVEYFRTWATELACSSSVEDGVPPNRRFLERFSHNAEFIRSAYEQISAGVSAGDPLTPDAEWLLDNFYVVEEQLREIRDDLPADYLQELPRLRTGIPRIYHLALELVVHTDSTIDQDTVIAFVNQFQTVHPLTIGEVWAVPIMLRLVLVENLRRLAGQLLKCRRLRHDSRDLLLQWQPGEALPALYRDCPVDPDLIAESLSVSEELFPGDPGRLAALDQALAHCFPDSPELLTAAHHRRAANQVTIGNIITSMRLISALNWVSFFEQINVVERILRGDPAHAYDGMDLESRDSYRHAVEDLAKYSGRSGLSVAQEAIALAEAAASEPDRADYERHVGYWLVDDGRPTLERILRNRPPVAKRMRRWVLDNPGLVYFGTLIVLGLLGLLIVNQIAGPHVPQSLLLVLSLLALIPLSELAVLATNLLVTHFLPPRRLPKLDFQDGVPAEHKTIIVVPAMLTGPAECDALIRRLETHYLGNADQELRFALLTDFADASEERTARDAELVERAVEGIRALNERYAESGRRPFYLFHRARQWNAAESVWMGWERKRGKLIEFNRLMCGDRSTSYIVQEGDLSSLSGGPSQPAFSFVITLDADTQLPLGAARRLIGALAHPLNRAVLDDDGQRVVHGYGLLQPRVTVQLADGNRTRYTQLFANSKGFDPYATAASDVYQDLFGEGSFTGKGIYDLRAFETTVKAAFPENHILSHDLIEGCHCRVGLVSDIEVIDGYPARYDADVRRNHRWVRGDWQIFPWILPRVPCQAGFCPNRLSLLSRWKIFDNLRRSLVPPALCALLVVGWLVAPQLSWLWSLVAFACIGFPALAGIVRHVVTLPRVANWRTYGWNLSADLSRAVAQTVVVAACLPHKAVSMLDAIARTLVRMFWTRRHLLEWETAAATEKRLAGSRWSTYRHMAYVPVLTVALGLVLPATAWPFAWPWLVLWFVSPVIADAISQPLVRRIAILSDTDRHWLRLVARNTWTFFEECVSERTHWLPPDNLQEYPQEKLAERISPTNEGLFLVSGLIARDFGYLGLHPLCDLWEKNLHSWTQLETLHGHFYNWYDTATLDWLRPRYVSAVDSGNLAASLMVLEQGVEDVCRQPMLGPQIWRGLNDTIEVALQACREPQSRDASPTRRPLDGLIALLEELRRAVNPAPASWMEAARTWRSVRDSRRKFVEALPVTAGVDDLPARRMTSLLRLLDGLDEDIEQLVPWLMMGDIDLPLPAADIVAGTRSLNDLIGLPDRLAGAFTSSEVLPAVIQVQAAAQAGAAAASKLRDRLHALGRLANRLVMQMDFRFLYNPQRRLFSIGYNVEDGRLDRSYYDMLCSEARLTSHLAIAKGDVPPKHWFQLGRQLTYTAGRTGLLSWGGTMFEFLMPPLFQRDYEDSLLSQACQTAVARQREYGQQRGVPWGVSESAFAALAINSDYHYQSFGVPGLGLKRGLSQDLVVAPYASMLALGVDAPLATANLRRLSNEGALGRWGFYEALDFTPERVPHGKRSLPVRCYMAHHVGMSLAAMANALLDNVVQKRFHAHPLVHATEMLLQESMSTATPIILPHADETAELRTIRPDKQMVSRYMAGYDTPVPRTLLLSNGQYAVMLTNTGGGYSRWGDVGLTRWRADVTQDCGGQFLYLKDRQSGQFWSATYQPTCVVPDAYEVTFSIDKAEYRRRDGNWETHLEITVSSEDPAEVRLLTLTNHSSQARVVEVTSYAEIALIAPAADMAHPAFHKLFIETEFIEEEGALLAKRRPREPHQSPLWAVHLVACPDAIKNEVQYETSRLSFLGRGRTPRLPAALRNDSRLGGQSGFVLDPVFALRCAISVPAHGAVSLAFTTGVAESREAAIRLADQFHEPRGVQRAFELAWAFNQVQLQHLHLSAAQAQRFQQAASYLLFAQKDGRGPEASLRSNRQSQSGLWRFGISGDRPILLLRVSEPDQVDFVREWLLAREYWELNGLKCDLVVLNTHPGSYLDALQEQLQRVVQETPRMAIEAKPALFLLRASQIAREDQWLLETVAHLVLDAQRGWAGVPKPPPSGKPATAATAPATVARPVMKQRPLPPPRAIASRTERLEFWNGTGGFAENGREYRIHLRSDALPCMPWSNVIANPRFGCLVTESGGGYTWAGNSRENKLTTWANDPVSDPPSELLFLRDDQTGDVWCPMQSGLSATAERWVHHGQGYSRFVIQDSDLDQEVLISTAKDDPVKFLCIKLTNHARDERTISATFYAELVLGVGRDLTQLHVVTEIDAETGALLARNPYHPEFPDQMAFLRVLGRDRSATGDRLEFLGRHFDGRHPAALKQPALSGKTGAGLDPCGAVQSRFTIPAGGATEVIFLLGCGSNGVETQQMLHRYNTPSAVHREIEQHLAHWEEILTAIQVETPNRAFDLLVNRWLLYQVLSCRIWGRSAYYQSGGAFGFRDQLQDTMALVYARPDLVREHLLRAASRQFEEGDVQHWWHPPLGRGTRTRFSDDLLFLPFTVAHYVRVTGDDSVLDEVQPYLHSPRLSSGEQERYEFPQISSESGTIYEHCLRALEYGWKLGEHGLPLMGCGDWNDGMNLVGHEGRGESVWVGWFLLVILDDFLPLMDARGDEETAARFRERGRLLREALERHAWDGEWYRRAYFDDGTPLGSRENDECQIDSLAQSWAVLAGANSERTNQAMDAVFDRLVFPADRLVALFTPPFDQTELEPGYIKGYLPGVRENGGQYTHAVLWLIQALTRQGQPDRAMSLFDLINPILHSDTPSKAQHYQVEPYVIAADVYSVPPHRGRGGWTWYTGSAAWAYRVAIEAILGLTLAGNQLAWRPCVPQSWKQFQVSIRRGRTTWRFTVESSGSSDGDQVDSVELVDDGQEHHITIRPNRMLLDSSDETTLSTPSMAMKPTQRLTPLPG